MLYTIEIPKGIEGDATKEGFEKYCEHFNCKLGKDKRGSAYWTVTSNDPLNFFWLGANLNLSINTGMAISAASMYLKK